MVEEEAAEGGADAVPKINAGSVPARASRATIRTAFTPRPWTTAIAPR